MNRLTGAALLLALLATGCLHGKGRGGSSAKAEGIFALIGAAIEIGTAVGQAIADRSANQPPGAIPASVPREERALYAYVQKCGPLPAQVGAVSECRMRIPNVHGASARCAYYCVDHCVLHAPAATQDHTEGSAGGPGSRLTGRSAE